MDGKGTSTAKIVNISDDYILSKLTKGRFVDNKEDFYLKSGSKNTDNLDLYPVPGGLYDSRIFGSLYANRCNCGLVRQVGKHCATCSSTILTPAERLTRYAAIASPVYYTNKYRLEVLRERFFDLFEGRIEFNFVSELAEYIQKGKGSGIGTNWRNIFNMCQFNVVNEDGIGPVLTITDDLTDPDFISLEGVRNITARFFPESLDDILGLMNKIVPVTPIALRPAKLTMFDGKRKLQLSKHSIIYRTIMYMIDIYSKKINETDNIYEETLYKAILREFIGNQLLTSLSDFSKPSKQNPARTLYAHRVMGSARGVITPDSTLKITEVGVPFHIAYELYKVEFIAYLADVYALDTQQDAIDMYTEANLETLKLFEEFVNDRDKHVLLNRNPTLHKYNMLCMKVRLTKDSTIHLPQMCCVLFGGDFDGDEMNIFAVPDDFKEYAIQNASPKYMVYYEKDHEFLFQFNHETLNGLIIASKVLREDDSEPREYVTIEDVIADYMDSVLEVYTPINFQGKITSYGRIQIEEIAQCDLDELIGPETPFNAKNVSELYATLSKYDPDTRVDMLQKLQEFVLQVVYFEGETTLSLEDMYSSIDKSYLDRIREVASSDLSKEEKLVNIDLIYKEYMDKRISEVDERVKLRISESSRMKMNAFFEMTMPQAIAKSNGTITVNDNSFITGLTEAEMVESALNNRKLLELKFKAVPTSGFLTRQLTTLGHQLVLIDGDDPENGGLEIPAARAVGRTTVDGKIVGPNKSSELVRVRSILTSDKTWLTPDMISTYNRVTFDQYDNGADHKGASFMMALTESTTQKGLSLKHGGMLFGVRPEDKFYAPNDCSVLLEKNKFTLTYSDGSKEVYPRGKSLIFINKTEFKKGDLICQLSKLYTFSYTLDCVVKTCNAIGRVQLQDVKNQINYNRCIALSDSVVHYEFDHNIIVVGGERIEMASDALYFIPDGGKVKSGEKFASGLENIRALQSKLMYIELYHIFRVQFRALMPHISEEIIESLYYLITDKATGSFQGVFKTNLSSTSFITSLAYGYAGKALTRAARGETKIDSGTYSSSVINPIMIGELLNEINK